MLLIVSVASLVNLSMSFHGTKAQGSVKYTAFVSAFVLVSKVTKVIWF